MAPRPIPPSQISSPSTSVGIQESHGGASDHERPHAKELRNRWRAASVERLSPQVTRSLELVLSDPSRRNVVQAVEQLEAADAATRASVLETLSILIENDFLREGGELSSAVQEIRSSLRGADDPGGPSSAVAAGGR